MRWLFGGAWWWRARLRYWWHESLPWAVAWMLPRKVALFAFVRVYAVLGECNAGLRPRL